MSTANTPFLQQLLQECESGTLKLPALPELAAKVREAVARRNVSNADIASLVTDDAALSERLIIIASNPLIGAGREIDLENAIAHLGTEATGDLVCTLCMEQAFHAKTELIDNKLRQLWEHSITVAAISHALASKFTNLSPMRAMLAGLIHDIGCLPILARAEAYPELLDTQAELDTAMSALHGRVGTAILEAWNFPAELIPVPANHENLERKSTQTDYIDIVTVANLQSYWGSQHPLAQMDWHRVPAFGRLGIEPQTNVIEWEETLADIREVQHLIGV